jgi:hypothetical protein
MTAAMTRYSPGEIVSAVKSLETSDPHTIRILATMIAGAIISGELPLTGGNLVLDILGRPRVEVAPPQEENRLGAHSCPDWDHVMIEPGTPEWGVCCCEGK